MTSDSQPVSQGLNRRLDELLLTANRQSQEYVRQLSLLTEHSHALRQQPKSTGIVLHAAHESQYFLISTNSFQEPGSIARATALYHMAAEGEDYPEDALRERQTGQTDSTRWEGPWANKDKGVQSSQAEPAAMEKLHPADLFPSGDIVYHRFLIPIMRLSHILMRKRCASTMTSII